MPDRTRRDIIRKTGYAVAAGALAGCTDASGQENESEDYPEPPTDNADPCEEAENFEEGEENDQEDENGQEESSELSLEEKDPFNLLVSSNQMYEAGAVSEEPEVKNIDIIRPSEIYSSVSDEARQSLGQNRGPNEQTFSDYQAVELSIFDDGINTIVYNDLGEEELVGSLEQGGLESYDGDMETFGWTLFEQTGSGLEEFVAVKDNYTVITSNDTVISNQDKISDPEAAMEVALATHEDELDSHLETDDPSARSLNELVDYIRNEYDGPLEGAQEFKGENTLSRPETDTTPALITASRYEDETILSGFFEAYGGQEVYEQPSDEIRTEEL